ncbi:MAG TPA: class I adenylate-forming enzyme family protein [Longimicrobiales bacterium]|nr:class I adenylate-forming enzyme family protein [Longimicrobiales bacterium]
MDPLRRRARLAPDAVAVEDADASLTSGALDALADELAATLSGSPAGPLAALLPPTPVAVATLFAAGRAGRALALLHPGRTPAELGTALHALRPAVLLCAPETAEAGSAAASPSTTVRVAPGPALAPPSAAGVSAGTPLPFEERAFILWTSGTRGRPRGVRLRGRALLASAHASARRLALGEDDRWLLSLNLAHVGGIAMAVRAIVLGSRLILRPRFDAAELLALLAEGRVTHASLVPTMLRRLLDAADSEAAAAQGASGRADDPGPSGAPVSPPPHARLLLIGGDHAPAALVRRALDAGWPLALTYGLTEAASQVCTAAPTEVRAAPDTVGRPLDGVQVTTGADGEILVRGDTVAEAYVTAAGEEPLTDADGWLHTGDAGALDDAGRLRVLGRLAERIVTGGVNVDPAAVEEVLRAVAGVRDAAVVGVPDPEWGERVAAALELESGDVARTDSPEPAPAELPPAVREAVDAHCRSLLSTPFRPRLLRALPLPRNPNGKVDRARVRALLEGSAGVSSLPEGDADAAPGAREGG